MKVFMNGSKATINCKLLTHLSILDLKLNNLILVFEALAEAKQSKSHSKRHCVTFLATFLGVLSLIATLVTAHSSCA